MRFENLPLPRTHAQWLALVLIFYFLLRLPFIATLPLLRDENLYALMADEMAAHPSITAHLFSQELNWRPALPFFVLAAFSQPLSHLPLPIEAAYRLPSVLFGAACVLLVYAFINELYKNADFALASAAIFAFNPLVIYVNNTALVDSLLLFFMLLCLLCYVRGMRNPKYFLAAGCFAFFAFMVKTVVAFLLPPLAIALIFLHCPKMLGNRFFLLSLLAIPLAVCAYYFTFQDKQLFFDDFAHNAMQKLPSGGELSIPSLINRAWGSLWLFFAFCIVWLGFYASGMLLYWRKHVFLLFWCLFIVFAISGGAGMPWYYLPIMPPLCAFAALPILAGQKADKFTFLALSLLLCASAALSTYFYVQNAFGFSIQWEKQAGIYLQGKNNTLLIGDYAAGTLFYKLHFENPRTTFCWLNLNSSQNSTPYLVRSAIYDYGSLSQPQAYTRLADFFWEQRDFKLQCNVPQKFDYVAAVNINESIFSSMPQYKKLAQFQNLTVYGRIN